MPAACASKIACRSIRATPPRYMPSSLAFSIPSRCRSLINRRSICATMPPHGQDHLPHIAPRGNMRAEDGHECTALFELMHDVQHVSGIAPQPVESGHDQFVTRVQELDHSCQFRGRRDCPPDIFSERIIRQPLVSRLASWVSRSWSVVVTRAKPMRAIGDIQG